MHVLVTGASSGLGAAMATHFARQGHALSLVARREPLLQQLAEQLEGPVSVQAADLCEAGAARRVVQAAIGALGPVDVLINNAGVQYVEPGARVSAERSDRLLAVNLNAPLRLMSEVLPTMVERGSGVVVNVTSVAGVTHPPWMAHYAASKAGLAAASETLSVELAGTGVRVITVYPGPVRTEMEAAARDALQPGLGASILPTGTPQGLAEAVGRAVSGRRARVFYPGAYRLARWLRRPSQWATNRFSPRPRSE